MTPLRRGPGQRSVPPQIDAMTPKQRNRWSALQASGNTIAQSQDDLVTTLDGRSSSSLLPPTSGDVLPPVSQTDPQGSCGWN